MEYALPTAWGQSSRGFWTKRKKTAMSMLLVLGLIAGIALAFKLFEQTVPNNVVRDASNFDFAVEVLRPPDGGGSPQWLAAGPAPGVPIFNANDPVTGEPISQFPGDTRQQQVRVINKNLNPRRAASFLMWVDTNSIVIRDCTIDPANPNRCSSANVVASTDQRRSQFLNFFTLSVDKEKTLQPTGFGGNQNDINENDHGLSQPGPPSGNHDQAGSRQNTEVCNGRLTELTRQSPCDLGAAEEAGNVDRFGQPTDTRWYVFKMREDDPGTDQSAFKGWTITFTMIFSARVPALVPSGLER